MLSEAEEIELLALLEDEESAARAEHEAREAIRLQTERAAIVADDALQFGRGRMLGQRVETEGALVEPGRPEQGQDQQHAGYQQQRQHGEAADEEDCARRQGIAEAGPEHVLAVAPQLRVVALRHQPDQQG